MPTPKTPASIVDEAGLRYKAKAGGTPFPESDRGLGSTMSCFRCGRHSPRSLLAVKRLLGKNQQVCKDGCRKTTGS
jgi:hypothetical protein